MPELGKVDRFIGADGRRKIYADGNNAALDAMTAMLRDGGAKTITFSWSSPFVAESEDDAPAGVPVTWACTVVFWHDRHPKTVGTSEPIANHLRGTLDALADVLRQLGANVSAFVTPSDTSAVADV